MGGCAEAGRGALQSEVSRIYFSADAGFANPEVYEYLAAQGIKYPIRLPKNNVLQEWIGYLLTRRWVGRQTMSARTDQRLVADDTQGKVDQDRREGRWLRTRVEEVTNNGGARDAVFARPGATRDLPVWRLRHRMSSTAPSLP